MLGRQVHEGHQRRKGVAVELRPSPSVWGAGRARRASPDARQIKNAFAPYFDNACGEQLERFVPEGDVINVLSDNVDTDGFVSVESFSGDDIGGMTAIVLQDGVASAEEVWAHRRALAPQGECRGAWVRGAWVRHRASLWTAIVLGSRGLS